jgi:hypothetical protein
LGNAVSVTSGLANHRIARQNDYAASTGSILFGGIDKHKFIGQLSELDLIADAQTGNVSSFTVVMQSFSLSVDGQTKASSTTAIPVILDSGTTWTYLPSSTAQQIYDALGAYDDTKTEDGSGFMFVDCKHLQQNVTFYFQFGTASGPTIAVPVGEVVLNNVARLRTLGLVLPRDLPFAASSACTLGLAANDDYYLLGDTFLRSAYVVYDLANNRVAIAQASLNSTDTDIVEIASGVQNLPDVTGVQSQASVTQTATGLPGVGGGGGGGGGVTGSAALSSSQATATATITDTRVSVSATGTTAGSGNAASSTTGNTEAKAVPAPHVGAVWVTVVAGVAVLAGGAIFSI